MIWFHESFRVESFTSDSLLDQLVSSFARAYVLSIFEFDADIIFDFPTRILINRFNGFETFFVWYLKESKIKICVGVDGDICVKLWFWNSLLEIGCFADLMVGSSILLFFRCFFWRSGPVECWIRSYVRSHWFGCSLLPGTPLYSPWTLDSSALSWPLTLPIKEQPW